MSTAGIDANSLPILNLTLRSKIWFVMVVAPTNFFETLTTCRYLFFSILFFTIKISASGRTISGATEGAATGIEIGFFLTGSYLLNQTF